MAVKRPVVSIDFSDQDVAAVDADLPEFRMVAPTSLLVDETYQRELSERSRRLIRRIVGNWRWRSFKPPVVAETEDGLEVIDGQHTAIAAASHPGIAEIPVMVVRAGGVADRAQAFIGHNRDRLAITPTQLHVSAIAAGDEEALSIQTVCAAAGVRILKNKNPQEVYDTGDTMALAGIRKLIERRGGLAAAEILKLLVEAECAPVTITVMRGVEALIYDPQYGVTAERVADLLQRFAPDWLEREAKVFAFAHRVPAWRGFAAVAFTKVNKRGGGDRMTSSSTALTVVKPAPAPASPALSAPAARWGTRIVELDREFLSPEAIASEINAGLGRDDQISVLTVGKVLLEMRRLGLDA